MANKHLIRQKALIFWGIALLVFILDRISKFIVMKNIPLNSFIDFKFFSLTHIVNTGTAFGLFKNISWFFILFALTVSIYLVVKYTTFPLKLQPVLGLILGGALGNVYDRIAYGAVIDFIDLHWWPSFNIADSAITIAILLLIVGEYIQNKRNI